ncbi:MAG: glutaminase [Dermatophilaceae bacterium]
MSDAAPHRTRGPIETLLDEVWREVAANDEGAIATYIPELAKADPSTCGISLATLDGQVYDAGDARAVHHPVGVQAVRLRAGPGRPRPGRPCSSKVGVEPTGDPFNSISLDDRVEPCRSTPWSTRAPSSPRRSCDGRRRGPSSSSASTRGSRRSPAASSRSTRTCSISERTTGDRNRAIAYLMRLGGPARRGRRRRRSRLYFRQCAVLVTARDLAVMAATLANGGLNPVTGEQVVPRDVVRVGPHA